MHARTTVRSALLTSPLLAWLGVFALLLRGTQAHAQSLLSQEQLSAWGHNVFACFPVVAAIVAMIKRGLEQEKALLPNWLAVARVRYWFWWAVALAVSLALAFSLWSGGYGGQLFLYHVTGVWAVLEFAVALTFLASGGMALLLQLLENLGVGGAPRVASAVAPNASTQVVADNVEIHDHEGPAAATVARQVVAEVEAHLQARDQ